MTIILMNKYPDAFNHDTILQSEYIKLVEKHSPDLLIETGTYQGHTTEFFCSFGIPVITTEWYEDNCAISAERLKNEDNVTIFQGDSATSLTENFHLLQGKKIIAFLDSHGQDDKVCERELELLSKLDIPPVILIHDFNVPGKNFQGGYYDYHPYDYDYFKPYFDLIYKEDGYTYRYNEESTGNPPVGVIILEPK